MENFPKYEFVHPKQMESEIKKPDAKKTEIKKKPIMRKKTAKIIMIVMGSIIVVLLAILAMIFILQRDKYSKKDIYNAVAKKTQEQYIILSEYDESKIQLISEKDNKKIYRIKTTTVSGTTETAVEFQVEIMDGVVNITYLTDGFQTNYDESYEE